MPVSAVVVMQWNVLSLIEDRDVELIAAEAGGLGVKQENMRLSYLKKLKAESVFFKV